MAFLGEGVLWPAEQRLQVALSSDGRPSGGPAREPTLERDATVMSRAAAAALVLLVAGTVLMVAQP